MWRLMVVGSTTRLSSGRSVSPKIKTVISVASTGLMSLMHQMGGAPSGINNEHKEDNFEASKVSRTLSPFSADDFERVVVILTLLMHFDSVNERI